MSSLEIGRYPLREWKTPGEFVGLGELSERLKGAQGLFYDIYNEHNPNKFTVNQEQLKQMVTMVRETDPSWLLTVSTCKSHLIDVETITAECRDNN